MTYRCSDCGRNVAPTPFERCWQCRGERNLTDNQRSYLGAVAELRIHTFPHCDPRVLHARGECRYCSMTPYDRLHELRRRFNVAHTGATLETGQDACPSVAFRPADIIDLWPGNRAAPI